MKKNEYTHFVADNLAFLRARKKESCQAVCNALAYHFSIEITYNGYWAYEQRKVEPNITMLFALCQYFEVSMEVMITKNLRALNKNNSTNKLITTSND